METESYGPGIAPPLVRLLACTGCDVCGHRHPTISLALCSDRRERARPTELHCSLAQRGAMEKDPDGEGDTAETAETKRIQSSRLELPLDPPEVLREFDKNREDCATSRMGLGYSCRDRLV